MPLVLDGSGGISGVDGTASNPAIEGTDSNTGIFYPAADTVAIGTGGTEALRVNSSQSLLLNTTSAPAASAKMKIATSARTGAFFDLTATGGENWIIDSTNTTGSTDVLGIYANGTTGWYLRDDGNVGVGTSSPGAPLDVVGNIRSRDGGFALSTGTTLRGGMYMYNRLTGSGADYSTSIFSETGQPIYFCPNGSVTRAVTITSDGNLLVGTTDSSTASGNGCKILPNGKFGAVGTTAALSDTYNYYNSTAGAYRFYVTSAGVINATSTTITAISDQRLKENIEDIDVGLDAVMALKPRKFDWKEGKGKDKKGDRGWIAQEFEQVFPDMISTWKDEPPEGEEPYKAVNADLIPILVKAIQELNAKVEAQAAEIAALKGNA